MTGADARLREVHVTTRPRLLQFAFALNLLWGHGLEFRAQGSGLMVYGQKSS